jgi:hypothetical protein
LRLAKPKLASRQLGELSGNTTSAGAIAEVPYLATLGSASVTHEHQAQSAWAPQVTTRATERPRVITRHMHPSLGDVLGSRKPGNPGRIGCDFWSHLGKNRSCSTSRRRGARVLPVVVAAEIIAGT